MPIALNNINNMVYAPTGGFSPLLQWQVRQLKDTDDDGLEDAATVSSTTKTRDTAAA